MEGIKEMRYIDYSPPDSETIYECPNCKRIYRGWDIVGRSQYIWYKLKDRDYMICKCKQRLYRPL